MSVYFMREQEIKRSTESILKNILIKSDNFLDYNGNIFDEILCNLDKGKQFLDSRHLIQDLLISAVSKY